MNSTLYDIEKSIKRTGRKITAGLVTAAVAGAVLPYKFEKKRNLKTGDDGYVLTSLLVRTSISPKREDSVADKTTFSVEVRPVQEICNDLGRLRAVRPKKPVVQPIVECPQPPKQPTVKSTEPLRKPAQPKKPMRISEVEDKKLRIATKKYKRLKKQIAKRHVKLYKQRAKRARRA